MVDGGGEAGFAELGGAHLLEGERAALEDFEHDGALEQGVVGEVHDAAAAGADLADELVVLDCAVLHSASSLAGWYLLKTRLRFCLQCAGHMQEQRHVRLRARVCGNPAILQRDARQRSG